MASRLPDNALAPLSCRRKFSSPKEKLGAGDAAEPEDGKIVSTSARCKGRGTWTVEPRARYFLPIRLLRRYFFGQISRNSTPPVDSSSDKDSMETPPFAVAERKEECD
ncbi:hypothetical protein KM043_000782 [Ampulex compressa]|nr:hypothetical protein KM043_000782 [Ampulex compressa]